MLDYIFERQIIHSVESARKNAELKIMNFSLANPEIELKSAINQQFSSLNFSYQNRSNSGLIFLEKINLNKIYDNSKENHFGKLAIGSSLVFAGQPILKKRFVMAGSSVGTSIASKYLSRAFRQAMPQRILGTRILGRALGRAVPYIGWTLLAIDVIELLVEEINNQEGVKSNFIGFGGGLYGGGGASGRW